MKNLRSTFPASIFPAFARGLTSRNVNTAKNSNASAIDVSVERNGLTEIDALITIYHAGGQSTELRFNKLWMTIGGGEYGFN